MGAFETNLLIYHYHVPTLQYVYPITNFFLKIYINFNILNNLLNMKSRSNLITSSNFIKKRHQNRDFLVNFVKFLRGRFLKNISRSLLVILKKKVGLVSIRNS